MKAVICRRTLPEAFPPDRRTVERIYTHDLAILAKSAALENELVARLASSATFRANWGTVSDWSEETRYQLKSQAEARNLVEAIGESADGVLAWLRRYW